MWTDGTGGLGQEYGQLQERGGERGDKRERGTQDKTGVRGRERREWLLESSPAVCIHLPSLSFLRTLRLRRSK